MMSMSALFILIPLIAATAALAFRKSENGSIIIHLSAFSLQLILAATCLFDQSFLGKTAVGGWPDFAAINLNLDALAALLIATSSIVFIGGTVYLFGERKQKTHRPAFTYFLLCLMQLGVNGAFLTSDLFNLFVFFEVLLIAALVLIVETNQAITRKAAVYYLGFNFLASALFLLGIGLIYQQTGHLSFAGIYQAALTMDEQWKWVAASLLFVCFATKAALMPFCFWLPKTYPDLSGAIGGIFGGLLTKVGLYALMRVLFILFPNGSPFFYILLMVSTLSMILGVMGAYAQKELRQILSYHIISQVGYIGGGIALAGLTDDPSKRILILSAVIFYFVHHIIVKSNLFFASSWMNHTFGSSELSKIRGLMHQVPILSILFAIPAMSLAGIPPFSGFWAKLAVIRSAFLIDNWFYIVVALVAGLFTFLSMMKVWNASFLGEAEYEGIPKPGIQKLALTASFFLVCFTLIFSVVPDALYQFCQDAAAGLIQTSLFNPEVPH